MSPREGFLPLLLMIAGLMSIGAVGCKVDNDCVPATCCQPTACVNVSVKPDCSAVLCDAMCHANTLTCGQGACQCNLAAGRCDVKWATGGGPKAAAAAPVPLWITGLVLVASGIAALI